MRRMCEVSDEKRAKKVVPEDVHEALFLLDCDDFVPTLKSLLDTGTSKVILGEPLESQEETEKADRDKVLDSESEHSDSEYEVKKILNEHLETSEEVCISCKKKV